MLKKEKPFLRKIGTCCGYKRQRGFAMDREITNELGRLSLSEDVIATIAGVAATECYGVVGMASRRVTDGLAELLGRENLSRGVDVAIEADKAIITLNVIVGYGTRISEVAKNIVDKVKYTVENATGLKVVKVKVNVQGVKVGPR
jgi:uncharacterized alkaline shock family protein YloU